MSTIPEFKPFPKIPRFSRQIVITEKIDGTNAVIYNGENGEFLTGSRTRWITRDADNYGFAAWAHANKAELQTLGPGYHFGEWWGVGIQRGYGLSERRFSLFNISRWHDERRGFLGYTMPCGDPRMEPKKPVQCPACCHVVPMIAAIDLIDTDVIDSHFQVLKHNGSFASPGFKNPEGIVIFHTASNQLFKKTFDGDKK